jgi:PAS domain S-box-containing protein
MPKASAYWIKLRRGLFAFGVLLVGLSILSALWTVRSDRARVEAEASRNFANLTALLAEQTARSLESVDLVLAAATSDMRVRGIGDPTVREVRMKDRISGITQIRSLLLLGPDGRVLVDTAGQIPAGIDMSDRTYFTAHRDGSAGRRFVSEPFQGRASGYWEFAVSERVTGTGDRFAGVLAAKMDLAYFNGLYRLLDIGPDGFVELATTDGKVITRVPGPRDAPGVLGTDSEGVLAALKRDGRFTGWSHGVGHAGADPALISAAAIPSLPLHVVVGAPARAVFAPWRAEAVRIGLATLLGSAVVLALVGFAARELARRAAADERTRQSEEALRARQEMLDLAQDAAQAAAFKWRFGAGAGDNRWSRALEPMLGLAPGTYDGTYDTWLRLVHAQDRPAVEAAIERARVTGDVSTEYRIVDRDGGVHWLQLKGRLLADADGGAARMVGFMLDVTDRRRAEAEGERQKVLLDELIESAPEAILFYDDAWRIVRVNREFTRIFGYAPEEILGTDAGARIVPEDRKAEAEEMRRRMGRGEHVSLEETVRRRKDGSLFDASLLGAPIWVAGKRIGALALLRDISERIGETLELVRGSLPTGIVLDLALPDAPLVVVGDPSQLHQVVMNLCSNAVYAVGRSGTLRVALEPVDVPAERALAHGTLAPGRYARLTVADTGRGMDAATLGRIFEPFFTTKEAGRGTGLGLSLVYGIVTDSGGAIQVTSAPGSGASFEIYLPQTEALVAAKSAEEPVPRGGGERVLLVDDEEPLTVMTAEVLAQLGYEAATFTDGRAALEAFEAAPEAFQVMVTDEVMPALTGTELARRVRRRRPDLPIVLLSGYSGPLLTQQALGAGVSELLKKPVQSRELAAALARVLKRAA